MSKRTERLAQQYEHMRFDDLPGWVKTIFCCEDFTTPRNPSPSEIAETSEPDPIIMLSHQIKTIASHHNNPFRR